MDREQESVLATITRFEPVKAKYKSSIDSIAALKEAFDELSGIGEELALRIGLQNANIKGTTEEKKEFKLMVSEETETMASALYSFARKSNNIPLATEMDIKTYQVLRLKDEIIGPFVTKVYNAANAHLADLAKYGITQTKLDAYHVTIDDFSKNRQMPKNGIINKHSHTVAIDLLCKRALYLLDEMLDKLMLQFKKTEPEFYLIYESTRKIDKTGSRKPKPGSDNNTDSSSPS